MNGTRARPEPAVRPRAPHDLAIEALGVRLLLPGSVRGQGFAQAYLHRVAGGCARAPAGARDGASDDPFAPRPDLTQKLRARQPGRSRFVTETAMPKLAIDTTLSMNDGHAIPLLGFGVYKIANGPCRKAVLHALEVGYRHIDTAAFYGNEKDVGRAVRESGIPREQIFVTTKLWNSDQGYASALEAFERSLERLGLDYVDLYLIHWPEPGRRRDSWRALVELKRRGLVRSIGVSNYTIAHLEELLRESDVVPANNQVEFSPFLYQKELLDYCTAKGITLTAYCPLTHGEKLDHPTVAAIGKRYGKTGAQVLLRWALQHGVIAIPKSARPARISENANLYDFELDADDMRRLDALDEGYRTSWDPTRVP